MNRMQQAVNTSSLVTSSTATTLASLLASAITRSGVTDKLRLLVDSLAHHLAAARLVNTNQTNCSTSDPLVSSSSSSSQEIEALLDKLATRVVESTFVLDPLIRPLIVTSDSSSLSYSSDKSFFENRHGFSHNELLDCEYTGHHMSNSRRLNRLLFAKSSAATTMLYHQQHRGFKTKRIVREDGNGEQGGGDLSSEFKGILSSLSSSGGGQLGGNSSLKRFNSLLTQSKKSGGKTDKTDDFLASTVASGNEQEKKLKLAFTEGVLFGSSRADLRRTAWRLVLFFAVLLFFFFPLSVSFNGSNGGRNGTGSGGGINLRTLTGNVDYEVNAENVTVKFEDVKGVKDAKKELMEIVDFLKDPEQYTKIGARLPKGVLLVGPPGCGKTMLAKAVAGEAGVPFFQANGSDFDEMFVGTGSKRVRSLFAAARAKAPCVIFIDEIDSVGSKRTNSSLHPHANQTINQLLAEMDGFKKNEGIIVLGATNRRETLDNALMRPGRFDLEVRVDRPDLEGRVQILESYLDKVARDPDIDINLLAKQLTGLGGSGIENVVNQAALRAATTKSTTVKMEHLEWSVDRARMGYGKTRLQDEECNRVTAYHEAGHALVGYFTKDADPLHKVTILPRSQSLGHTSFVPDKDQYSITRSQLLARMDVAFGGRVAEEMIFGVEKVTTGAYADYQGATSIATNMIKNYGMSEKLGPRTFGSDDPLSLQTQEIIDGEIKRALTESYERARGIIKTHAHELKLIAEALLIHETLDSEQVKRLIENHKL